MLSIVLPCYNEGQKLIQSINEIVLYNKDINLKDYEIIIVNDGSKDDTLKYIKKVEKDFPNIVRYITYETNQGKGYAVKQGILNAEGDYVLFMDVDLSTNLSAIKTTLDLIKKKKPYIIIGSRRLKKSNILKPQGFTRKFIGNGCKFYTNLKLHLSISDTQCGFKCFKTDIAKKLVNKQTINRWAFDAELLYIAKLNKIKIYEIPVTWVNDSDSRVSPMSSSIQFMKDLSKIKKNKKNYYF